MLGAVLVAVLVAHGTPPQTLQILEQPGAASPTRLVGTTFGALVSTDACSWQWVCDKSVGYAADERPAWWVSKSGTIFSAAYSGLFRSTDKGCTWAPASELAEAGAADVGGGEGNTIYAVSGKFGADNGLFASSDDGVTFERTSLRSKTQYFSAVRARGSRVYVSSWYFDPRTMGLEVSADGASSFTHVELTNAMPEGAIGPFTLLAIDPADDAVLYASVFNDLARPQTSLVFRSTDAGQSWVRVLSAEGRATQVTFGNGFTWVAVGDHVYRAATAEALQTSPALESPNFNACVYTLGDVVLACGSVPFDGFAIAEVTNGDAKPWLQWSLITGPQNCPAGTAGAEMCAASWPVQQNELGITGQAAPSCPAGGKACGCSSGPASVWALLAVAGLVYSRHRRHLL